MAGALIIFCVSILVTLGVVVYFVQRASEGLEQRYAAMQFAYTLSDYLIATDGDWPRSWEAFELAYDQSFGKQNQPYATWRSWIEPFVVVDWNIDLTELRAADTTQAPPYPVVRLANGGHAGPTEWHEANAIIFRAFQEIESEPSLDSNLDIIQP